MFHPFVLNFSLLSFFSVFVSTFMLSTEIENFDKLCKERRKNTLARTACCVCCCRVSYYFKSVSRIGAYFQSTSHCGRCSELGDTNCFSNFMGDPTLAFLDES